MKTERRSAIKKIFASAAGLVGFGIAAKAKAPKEKTVSEVINFQEVPLISRSTKYDNLLFLTEEEVMAPNLLLLKTILK